MNQKPPRPDVATPDAIEVWHLPINQIGYHLALTEAGLFRIHPTDPVPEGAVRLYPGMLHAWRWFERDGGLRPEFAGRPVWGSASQ